MRLSRRSYAQEFAYRFIRGEFRYARPEKGRFRDYVKVSVLHLTGEYRRARRKDERLVTFDSRMAVSAPDTEITFRHAWTTELLNRTWAALRRYAEETGQQLYEVLKLRADEPARRSVDIAAELTGRTGRDYTPAGVRRLPHRAREKYAELLWREVAESLPTTDPSEVTVELAELGLLVYCQPFLKYSSC